MQLAELMRFPADLFYGLILFAAFLAGYAIGASEALRLTTKD